MASMITSSISDAPLGTRKVVIDYPPRDASFDVRQTRVKVHGVI
jgi:hypothetical protein